MNRRFHVTAAISSSLMLGLLLATSWGRGFGGGGGFGGAGHGPVGGGGFGGPGHGPGAGGFGSGGLGGGGFGVGGPGAGGLGGAARGPGAGGFGQGAGGLPLGGLNAGSSGGPGGGRFDGGLGGEGGFGSSRPGGGGEGTLGQGGFSRGTGAGPLGGGNLSRDSFGDRFPGSPPSASQLNNFLGLPSDQGLHNLSSSGASGLDRESIGKGTFQDEFDVNRGSIEGPRGGHAAGATVTGPQGNTVGGAVAAGPNGGVAGVRGFEGSGGAAGIRGAAVGPEGRVAAGGAVVGPNGGVAARGAIAGPHGAAAGFVRVSPSGRYSCAVAVRGSYSHWDIYGAGWYSSHPAAWRPVAWTAATAWTVATWNSVGAWMSYYPVQPVYYDYGNNVTYQDNSVTVNGQDTGTGEEYYQQALGLAATGAQADASPDDQWLPLGVFALVKAEQQSSDVTIQLAVNKQGVVRGNYTDTATNETQLIQGSVDKQTQRVAFTVGDNSANLIETGLYNLTKDEAPCLLHFGKDRTEQWLLVRLEQPSGDNGKSTNQGT